MSGAPRPGWPAPVVPSAPAPTGSRTGGRPGAAFSNCLSARPTGGTFVLRIEDTDAARSREDLVDGISSALRWLGLDWDEGPVRQSERLELYPAPAQRVAGQGGGGRGGTPRGVDRRPEEGPLPAPPP